MRVFERPRAAVKALWRRLCDMPLAVRSRPGRTTAPPAARAAHIALVLHDFSTGGSERIAIRLANAWAAAGRRVTILCGTEDGPARRLVGAGVSVLGVRPAIVRGPLSRLRLGWALAHYVRMIAPDLIFAPGNFHLPVLAALARALPAGRPPFACKISNPLRRAGRGTMTRALGDRGRRAMMRAVDLPVAMAPSLAAEAQAVLRRADIACIAEPNFDAMPAAAPGPLPTPPVILCIGRLAPQKSFALALDAFARLPADASLILLGDGPDRDALSAQAARLGIANRVTFAGHVGDVRPYLATASLLLCTSRYEGYPAVLVEALAAGLPVVTTACSPAISEIMNHPSFGTIAPHDATVLADAMLARLAGGRPDAAATRHLAGRHLIGTVAADYLARFDAAVAARRGG